MEAHWLWWLAAVSLLIAEMFSGTFYLLAVALGLMVAGAAAFVGTGWGMQAVIAALLCSGSVAAIYFWKKRSARPDEQPNLASDLGQEVHVVEWEDDHNLRVRYRGAEWTARLASGASPDRTRAVWRIRDVSGSCLIVE